MFGLTLSFANHGDAAPAASPIIEHSAPLFAEQSEHAGKPYDLTILARNVDQSILNDDIERSGNEPLLSSTHQLLHARDTGLMPMSRKLWARVTQSKAAVRAERFIAGLC